MLNLIDSLIGISLLTLVVAAFFLSEIKQLKIVQQFSNSHLELQNSSCNETNTIGVTECKHEEKEWYVVD